MRLAVLVFMAVPAASSVRGQEGVFLSEQQAPAAVFPDANHFARFAMHITESDVASLAAFLRALNEDYE